jgi:hypothetical protein
LTAIDFNSFMTFCKGLEGQTLPTVGGRARFVLSLVQNDCLYYIVESTRKLRHSTRPWIEAVLNHYAITESLRPVDYQHITFNASYTLSLIKLYLEHQRK